ncbi:MAG: Glycosyl transferase, family 2 [Candidatus Woesebacteria bacterium GW2011_GWB1_43_14]|uniref:Glycosyl transferase, family 2 n=1 Tax=Candidatus Woesebacteria bacterium GW2011_GWB1_43_14 TaxID=1618578 RepID=A0A0G1DLK4_9BACT|nr:MAG: Glycosyl transferase, family 2 [Candidatus Woesebacteria bacterium GW2011_GWB1_43_14]
MQISIIIPNWNGKRLLEKNLPAVVNAKGNSKNNIAEIIIVDDKSTDDSIPFLESNYGSEVKIIRHRENRGFSSAVNTGVRSAKSPLVCLLNTDVVPSVNFLEAAIIHFSNPHVFGVSLHEQGYGYAKGKFEDGFMVHDPGKERPEVVDTFWVSGGSGIFRKETWKELKGMDELLFSPFYWEDIDLSYRAMKRGYRVLWEPKAQVIHNHESVINEGSFRKGYMNTIKQRNHLLFIWKNLTSPNLFKKHTRGLIKRVGRHPGYIRIVFMAFLKLLTVRKLRRKEKRESKVSDEAILARFK